jgi:hypothetical protein
MNLKQLKERCMAQIGGDLADLEEYLPELNGYLNAGYDLLVGAYDHGRHIARVPHDPESFSSDDPQNTHHCQRHGHGGHETSEIEYAALRDEADVPALPEWSHWAIADYATYLLYRNGNLQRQQRGIPFLRDFNDMLARLRAEGGRCGIPRQFHNLYVYSPSQPARVRGGGFDPLEG